MKTFFIFIIVALNIQPQSFTVQKVIGNFKNANSFYVNPAGFIYVSCVNENKIYKLDTLGNVLKDIGGYGWDNSAFDFPADIFATPLNVYVTDKNNHRIQWFDKNLNYISQLQTKDNRDEKVRFGYPLGSAVSSQGDFYILDSDNNRILKFDMFGNFLTEFGGLDAGRFRISKPVALALSGNTIYILDSKGKRVVVFDQFGNGLNLVMLQAKADNISSAGNRILLNNRSEIFYLDPGTGGLIKVNTEIKENIRDVFLFNKKMFVLTPSEICILAEG